MYKLEINRTIEVDEEWLQSCIDYLNGWLPFEITIDQMWELFKSEPDLLQSSYDIGFDTGEREWAMSLLSKKLIGQEWPMYCQSEEPEFQGFEERLIKAASKAGYKMST